MERFSVASGRLRPTPAARRPRSPAAGPRPRAPGAPRRAASTGSPVEEPGRPVGEPLLAAHRRGPPSKLPDRRREPALGDAEPAAGEHGSGRGDRLPRRVEAERIRPPAGQRREAAPGGGEPEVGVEAAAEQLEVVGGTRKPPKRTSGTNVGETTNDPGDADRKRPAEAGGRQRDQRPPREPRAERPALQLVEGVGADPDREEERGHRGQEAAGVDICGDAAAPIAT